MNASVNDFPFDINDIDSSELLFYVHYLASILGQAFVTFLFEILRDIPY